MSDPTQDEPLGHLSLRVPGKINLFLGVRGVRDDGYHELVTVMQTIGLHDTVEVAVHGTPAQIAHPAVRKTMRVTLTHDGPDLIPTDEGNLAVKAARIMLQRLGAPDGGSPENGNGPHTTIDLAKRIPVAGGMAGGSANAAATMVALNELWDCNFDRDELREMAAELGADVPFCVTGGTALATGTGTTTAQVLVRGDYHWVVGISRTPLSTPQVYKTFDEVGTPSQVEPDAVLTALRTGDAEALGAALYNDLEQAAFHLRPTLRDARDQLLDAGALGAIVSGSGPTMLALAGSALDAQDIARKVAPIFDEVVVTASPAGGPEHANGD